MGAWLNGLARGLGAALAIAGFSACAPLPPADPTIALSDGSESDGEPENDVSEAAPAAIRPPEHFRWIDSEEEGVAKSTAERRPMLVHFAAQWCAACKRMATETFGDPRFQSQAGRFVAVRIDATNEDDPQVGATFAKYTVLGVPTLIVIDSRGREQRRFTDFIRADQLLGEIQQVR